MATSDYHSVPCPTDSMRLNSVPIRIPSHRRLARHRLLLLLICFTSVLALPFSRNTAFADALPSGVAQHNLCWTFSRAFIEANLQRSQVTQEPVSDIILGTTIRGSAESHSRVSPRLVPSHDTIGLSIDLATTVHSFTTGVNGSATVKSKGVTEISGTKLVHLSPRRFAAEPATSQATTRTQIVDFGWSRLVGAGIARKRADSQKRESEKISATRAAAKAKKRFDKQVNESLVDLHAKVMQPTWDFVRARYGSPDFRFSTTSERVQVVGAIGDTSALPSNPQLSGSSGFAIQIHQTLANALTAQQFANAQLAETQWFSKLKRILPSDGSSKPADQRKWSVELAAQPFAFEFEDNQFSITIRAKGFRVDEKEYPGMQVQCSYEIDEDQPAKSKRIGAVSIRPLDVNGTNRSRRGGRQQIFRSLLRKRVNPLFVQELDMPQLLAELAAASDVKLPPISGLHTQDGWLTIFAD